MRGIFRVLHEMGHKKSASYPGALIALTVPVCVSVAVSACVI